MLKEAINISEDSLRVDENQLLNLFFDSAQKARDYASQGKHNLAKTQYLLMLEVYDRLRNDSAQHEMQELAYNHISEVFKLLNPQ